MKTSSSVSVQLLIVVLVTVVSVLAVSSFVELKILERLEDAALQSKGMLTADRIAYSLANPMWNLDQAETERVLVHELDAADVVRVQVFDEDGKLYIGKLKDGNGKLLIITGNDTSGSFGRYSFTRDVIFKDTKLGTVRLDVTDEHARSELQKLSWGIAVKLLLVAIVLSVVLFLALRSLVIRPLSTLKSWINDSSAGVAGPIPHFKRSKEINTVAAAFGELRSILRSKNVELEAEQQRLEKVLAESRDIYDNAPCGYHSLDKDRVYIQVNETELGWLGRTREEVIGKLRFDDVLTEESKRVLEAKYPEFMVSGSVRDIEYELLAKDGTTKPILLSATAAHDAEGNFVMSRSTLYDIEERKRAEDALRLSEERFAKAFLTSPIGIAVTRLSDGKYLEVNETLARAVGYEREELIGQSILEVGIWEATEERDRFIAAVQENGFVRDFEQRFRSRDGKIKIGLLSGDIIEIAGEKCFLTVAQDITERRYMEQLLTASESLLRVFIKHAPASIAMFDNKMCYIQVSDRFLADYGLEGQDLAGRCHYDVFPTLPDKWKAVHRRVLAGAHEKCDEDSYSFDTRNTEWVQWEALPWRKPGGEVGGLILMTQVITHRKQAEMALRASEERFAKIFDLSPFRMGIVRISDGVILDVNAAWLKETGFKREEIVGRKVLELTQWLNEEIRLLVAQVLKDGKSIYDVEAEVSIKSGEKRVVLASIQRVEFDEPCFLWAANDITDRKRAETLLQASEQRFSVAFNSSPVMTSVSRTGNGQFLAVNDSFLEVTGYSREEVIGNTALELGLWIDPMGRDEVMHRLLKVGSLRDVEMRLRTKGGDTRVLLLSIERIEVDSQPCLLHAAIDITERRRAQDQNRRLLHNLGERIKELTALHNASRVLQQDELPFEEVLNEIAQLLPLAFQYPFIAAARVTLGDLQTETPNFTRDFPSLKTEFEVHDGNRGSIEVVYFKEVPPEAEGPYLLEERALLETLADMLKAACDRRMAEDLVKGQRQVLEMIALGQPLQETLDALLKLIENQASGMKCSIQTLDPDGIHLRYASAPSLPKEFVQLTDGQEIGSESSWCGLAAYLSEPVVVTDISADPRWQNYQELASKHGLQACWSTPIYDPQQKVIGVLTSYYTAPLSPTDHQIRLVEVATNIAAVCIGRKREEEALQISELRYRSLYETSPDSVRVFDADLRLIMTNQQGVKLFGYDSAEEMIGLTAGAFVAPEMRVRGNEVVEKVMSAGELVVYETIGVRKDGSRFDMESRLAPTLDSTGQPRGLLSVGVDITIRKRAEAALRESEELFRTLAETVDAAITIYRHGRFIYVNPAAEHLTGYSRQELEQIDLLDLVHPEAHEAISQRLELLQSGDPRSQSLEHKMITKGGAEQWMSARAAPMMFRGEPAIIITSFDITNLKRAEEELQRSEKLYRTVVSSFPDSVVTIYDDDLRCITIDGPLMYKLGFRREEIIGKWFGEGAYARGDVDEETFEDMKRDYLATFRGESRTREVQFGDRVFLARTLPINYANKTACMAIALDITERKRAEMALRASEERYRTLFETAPNAISVFDSNLRLQMTNERGAKLFGFKSTDDLIGSDFFRFVRLEDRPRIMQLFTRVQETGSLELFESLGIRKDGTRFLMETMATLLPDQEGKTPSILTVKTDITERKEAEKALKDSEEQLRALSARMRSAREEEGTRIAREIHDELGGALTGLKWDLEGIDSRLAGNGKVEVPEVRKRITSMTGLIETTINTVRRISSELRPGVLDDLGLVAAIEWQGQQFQTRTGLKFHFETELDMAEVNREGATAVFRIFQEVLTNVLRHSQAQNIYVKLVDLDDVIELEVRDDGRGITEREKKNTRSLGLLGMKERALLVGGNVTIRGSKGRGTTVTVRVPKDYEAM